MCAIEIYCSTPSFVFHVKHELNVTVTSVKPDNCNYKCRLMCAKMGAIVPLIILLANTLTKCWHFVLHYFITAVLIMHSGNSYRHFLFFLCQEEALQLCSRKCVISRLLWLALPRETGLLERRENMNAIAPDSMLILILIVPTGEVL